MLIQNYSMKNKNLATAFNAPRTFYTFNEEGIADINPPEAAESLLTLNGYFKVEADKTPVGTDGAGTGAEGEKGELGTLPATDSPEPPVEGEVVSGDVEEENAPEAPTSPVESESDEPTELDPPSSPDLTREELEDKHYTFVRDYATDRGFNIIGADGKTLSTAKIIDLIFA